MLWTVPPIWKGETCAIIAGGPSLRGFNAEVLPTRWRVITINDAWKLEPLADIHYYCDQSWIASQKGIDFDSLKWVKGDLKEGAGVDERVRVLRITGQLGFDRDPSCLRHGSNSAYQCIHLAAHLGVSRIVLLGVDMKVALDGRTHCHNGPRLPAAQFQRTLQQDMLPLFQYLVKPLETRGIEVINANPESALTCWPRMPLTEVLRKEGAESSQSQPEEGGGVVTSSVAQ